MIPVVIAGCKLTAGGQTSVLQQEAQGEVWPRSADQQQAAATDISSGTEIKHMVERSKMKLTEKKMHFSVVRTVSW